MQKRATWTKRTLTVPPLRKYFAIWIDERQEYGATSQYGITSKNVSYWEEGRWYPGCEDAESFVVGQQQIWLYEL